MVLAKPWTAAFCSADSPTTLSTAPSRMFALRMFRYGAANRFPPKAGLPPSSGPINISVMKRGSAGSKLYDSRPRMPRSDTYPFWGAMPVRVPMRRPDATDRTWLRVGLFSKSCSPGLFKFGTSRSLHAASATMPKPNASHRVAFMLEYLVGAFMAKTPRRWRTRSFGSVGTASHRCSARWAGSRSCSLPDRGRCTACW